MRLLVLLVCLGGIVQLAAVVPMLFPFSWMAAIHEQLGMGTLPDRPITHYLARSLSGLYAAWGAIYLFVATDLQRYLPLLKFMALLKLLAGIALLSLDVIIEMPWFWTMLEGPVVMAYSLAVLAAIRSMRARESGAGNGQLGFF